MTENVPLKLPDAVSWAVKIRSSQSPGLMVPVGVVLSIEVAGDVPLSYWNSTVLLPRMRAEMNEKPALKPVEFGARKPICSGLLPEVSPATAVTYSDIVWTWPSERLTVDGTETMVESMAADAVGWSPPPAVPPVWSLMPNPAPQVRLMLLAPPLL